MRRAILGCLSLESCLDLGGKFSVEVEVFSSGLELLIVTANKLRVKHSPRQLGKDLA
jgi:hypothetical protein